ncbi:Ig-like domain-containing protein [Micrococcus terreus]|uniref:Ig-like domain-containing protein n=1 Tax=Micrococcus terreus TaxID=574650 RepID=UPI0035CD3A13
MPRVDSTVSPSPSRASAIRAQSSPRTSPRRTASALTGAALLCSALVTGALPAAADTLPEPSPSPSESITPTTAPPLVSCPGLLVISGRTESARVEVSDASVTITAGRSTAGGQVSVSGLTVTYTAPTDYAGEDYIPVTATDTEGTTSSCEITVKVEAAPTPPPPPGGGPPVSPPPGPPPPPPALRSVRDDPPADRERPRGAP